MKKKEVLEIFNNLPEYAISPEFNRIVTEHFNRCWEECDRRGVMLPCPFDEYDPSLSTIIADKYASQNPDLDIKESGYFFVDVDFGGKSKYVVRRHKIPIEHLWKFDYCKFGRSVAMDKINELKKRIEANKKSNKTMSEKIKMLRHKLKEKC